MKKVKSYVDVFPIQWLVLNLGLFSLANLLAYLGLPFFRYVVVLLFAVLLGTTLLRAGFFPSRVFREWQKPAGIVPYVAGAFCLCFSAGVLAPHGQNVALFLWLIALAAHAGLTYAFMVAHVKTPASKRRMLPVWYLIFVGTHIMGISGSELGLSLLPEIIVTIAFLAYLILTPFICRELLRHESFPPGMEPTKSLMCAAPALCFVALSRVGMPLPSVLANLLIGISQFFLIWVYGIIGKSFARERFSLSYASFTFALGISALGFTMWLDHFGPSQGGLAFFFTVLACSEIAIAFGVIAFITFAFLKESVKMAR